MHCAEGKHCFLPQMPQSACQTTLVQSPTMLWTHESFMLRIHLRSDRVTRYFWDISGGRCSCWFHERVLKSEHAAPTWVLWVGALPWILRPTSWWYSGATTRPKLSRKSRYRGYWRNMSGIKSMLIYNCILLSDRTNFIAPSEILFKV